jgi:two-component system response regulator AtoC
MISPEELTLQAPDVFYDPRVEPPDTSPPPTSRGDASQTTIKEMERAASRGLHLVVFHKDGVKVFRVPRDRTITVGRSDECEVQVEVLLLSRKHFTVLEGTPPLVRDLKSANGTKVDGKKITPDTPTPLEVGNLIEAGGIFFMLRDHDPHGEFSAQPVAAGDAQTAAPGTLPVVVVEDPAMTRLHELVDLVARSNISVLVVGETGVGKEVISAAVHQRSPRADKPYVRLNCAALPETLLESELFGYEKGAFTGATQAKQGLIESAHGGSFFLDEIGEMPLATQSKLLRVLENGELMRLGALKPRSVDVRFIAATNRNIGALVAKGTFRRDLYFRLNGITIPIPPLRERAAEIPALAKLFLNRAAKRVGRSAPSIATDVLEALQQHSWPGNIRELRNVMDRAMTLCRDDTVRSEHLILDPEVPDFTEENTLGGARNSTFPQPVSHDTLAPPAASPEKPRGRLLRMDADAERKIIIEALEQAGGNQSKASEILGVSRRTLINRLDEYGLKRPRKND